MDDVETALCLCLQQPSGCVGTGSDMMAKVQIISEPRIEPRSCKCSCISLLCVPSRGMTLIKVALDMFCDRYAEVAVSLVYRFIHHSASLWNSQPAVLPYVGMNTNGVGTSVAFLTVRYLAHACCLG
jgi:hypothetical protein